MVTPEIINQRIAAFPERCRAAGLKLTPQRSAVYAVLAGVDTHPTPETILVEVRRQMPSISQGTVYKVLDLLAARGLLIRVATPGQAARYDVRTDPHSHAVCVECGRLADLETDGLGDLPARLAAKQGFSVHKTELLAHGYCADCRPGS